MDDGVLTALLLGPLVAGAALFASLQQSEHSSSLPSEEHPLAWLIDSPLVLNPSVQPLDALVRSRRYLIQLTTLCSAALLVHLCTSRWTWRDGYTSKSEGTRTWYFIWFSTLVAGALFTLKRILRAFEIFVWTDLSTFDIVVILLFYQLSLYVMVRLGRRAFTLGELGAVGHGATAMFMETVYLTSAKIWPVTTLYVKTFRLPTPLLTFQLALIPGAFLTGFLLSPLLVLSRNIAQKPYRRLRLPHEKLFHQRALAAGFYVLAAAIVAVIVGSWTQWCLGGQNPWKWVVLYIFEGRRNWSRVALLGYWGLLGTISVGAWERQLAKARKYRQEGTASGAVDAGEKDASLLSVNGRRKFFHALAVMMFAPGIAFDPAFAHLSFSVAFSLFIFVEYVRYFALYPFGASVHLFMNEFLDEKDGGTVILSHFYLLTGCAGSVWLEGPSRILALTGVLVLGVGDSLASVVGKRHGRHRWSASTPKTIEGSVAFATCVLASAWLLSVFGLVESFSIPRYALAVGFGSVLEALSLQNDNLVLPFFTWSMLVLLRAVTGT
ncbi:hypothetical protein BOTBODRAFT_101902 [Botryobasidium botryosum FD-172 SS1]|uniref:dolichol kinase n=1 Tax=Botryobasidium botryosum (strain FD-172 SS1) TaxID=930990 RepID=A0A067MW32_BOTB1|nr:hypothetical protein BOTBODRAFT_101902 [Botryobasidium botryosum FD-172 SS1]